MTIKFEGSLWRVMASALSHRSTVCIVNKREPTLSSDYKIYLFDAGHIRRAYYRKGPISGNLTTEVDISVEL